MLSFYNGLDRNSTICFATAMLSEPALACSPGGILCIPLVGALLLRVLLTWLQRCFWELCSLKIVGYAICPYFFISGYVYFCYISQHSCSIIE